MPPRKRASTTDEPLARLPALPAAGVSTPLGAQSPAQERRDREWEELVEEVGTEGRIKVWHVVNGKSIYAGEMSIDGFSLETLMDTYGGGDKSLVFYSGKTKHETTRVSLDPSIPIKNPRGATAAPTTPAPQAGGLGDIATVLATMAQMSMQAAQSQSQMMTGMVTAVTALLAAKPEKDPTELALKVVEAMKPASQAGGATSAAELFTIFEKGMNMADKFKGGDEDGTLALAREGLGVVAKIVENQGKVQFRPRPAAPPPPPRGNLPSGHASTPGAGGTGGAPPVADAGGVGGGADAQGIAETQVVSVRPWVDAARPAAALLLLSIGNVEPATAAQVIADRLDDDAFSDLLSDIEAGTPAEFLERFREYFGLEPFTDDTGRWMLSLIQEVKALVDEDGGDLTEERTGG